MGGYGRARLCVDPWVSQYDPTQRFSHRVSLGMQAPSEEEEFHSVSLLFSFRLFVPNRRLFSVLILLFSAKTPDGRPSRSMSCVLNFFQQRGLHHIDYVVTNKLLTGSVPLHLDDTFWVLARLPGVEGPYTDGNFYRCSRHVCSLGLFPQQVNFYVPPKGKHRTGVCLHLLYKKKT